MPNGKLQYNIGASNEEFVFMIARLRLIENEKDGISLKTLKHIYEKEIASDKATVEAFVTICHFAHYLDSISLNKWDRTFW